MQDLEYNSKYVLVSKKISIDKNWFPQLKSLWHRRIDWQMCLKKKIKLIIILFILFQLLSKYLTRIVSETTKWQKKHGGEDNLRG